VTDGLTAIHLHQPDRRFAEIFSACVDLLIRCSLLGPEERG
jgi:hypothetical protein